MMILATMILLAQARTYDPNYATMFNQQQQFRYNAEMQHYQQQQYQHDRNPDAAVPTPVEPPQQIPVVPVQPGLDD